ncbi:MAG: tRNA-dihydrouridine synthase family protein [Bacteroidota bacterium]
MIYFAPIQGFTDFIYREAYAKIFGDVEAYFIPYISVKNNKILNKYFKEIISEHNKQKRVIPQVLVKDSEEILYLSEVLSDYGYTEINMNLGCPYPMVTNRGKGAGLLPYPEKLERLLDDYFNGSNLKLSVKLRAGLNLPEEIEKIVPVLNRFPLTEIIVHPRIAKQLYKGEIIESAYRFAYENLEHRIIFNGDIFSVADFVKRKEQYPKTTDWMLGRGVLMNPFLPSEIKGTQYTEQEKKDKLRQFHQYILTRYSEIMDNEGNALNKMKQFWVYFSNNFSTHKKAIKKIKKTKSLGEFRSVVQEILHF